MLSQFQALSTALASTIGTGNIAGVSTAIVVGGPGSIFWMWICAIFGMATHFAEIVLGIYFRNYEEGKGYSGGPMYYLENGIGKQMKLTHLGRILAILFALFTFIASYGIGNMTQINSISEALKANFNVPPLVCGIVLATIAALIIFGGISRIGKVAERIVPFMALFYIIVGIIMVVLNIKNVPAVFVSIFTGAFNTQAIAVTLFAFTTILGWSYYGSQTIGYIFGKVSIYIYKVFYILFIVVGSVMSLNLVWNIIDTFNALMVIPNLIGLLLLSGTVIKIVKNYYDRQKEKKVAPMISFHKMK